jgi:3-methyladenine DNA glycosylase AlkD
MTVEERIARTDDFLPLVDNWATCDMFCQSWKVPKKDGEKVHGYFRSMIDSGEEFPMRVSLILRMSHFMDEAHVDALIEDILDHDYEGYYYKMGAAWALSVCYIHFPDRTEDALRSDRLDADVLRKAMQKIRDSYRVSQSDKERLRATIETHRDH